jgi:hypothetical protein
MKSFSFLDLDGQGRAGRCGIAGVLLLLGGWAAGEQDDDAIVVALVEYVAGVEHALAG